MVLIEHSPNLPRDSQNYLNIGQFGQFGQFGQSFFLVDEYFTAMDIYQQSNFLFFFLELNKQIK